MEKGTDGKMKSVASIPENYVSILQLQERWMKGKERKHKERDLGVKQQQVNEQREEVEEPMVNLEECFHIDRREKESNCIEKEVSATVSKKGEDGGYWRERKKKWSKKKNKKNQGGSPISPIQEKP
ncbi:hypothetical protein IGI04_040271 [Brassica rapa subsp. trilocularis]|uniref:Uncharacterized protein n=1 Tax=Brassica rapa subsp. trilocularis TaxID=1813537 RepID=A0ABQ7KMD5_BRACM|nr:hypothetical protein IGI04_040271 [Brassica rapa subsp. trilocularis]